MDKMLNVLLIDDQPMVLEMYKNLLLNCNIKGKKIQVDTAKDCFKAGLIIKFSFYELIISEILFPINEKNIDKSIEDLCILIKSQSPKSKIILISSIVDNFRILRIMKSINPNGFLIKSETTSDELLICIKKVLKNKFYCSPRVSRSLSQNSINNYGLDDVDRKILYLLSNGSRNSDIANDLNLSLRTIENRKKKLKIVFNITERGNKALLQQAKKAGYI